MLTYNNTATVNRVLAARRQHAKRDPRAVATFDSAAAFQTSTPPRLYEVPVYRTALIREASVTGEQRMITGPGDAASAFYDYLRDTDKENFCALLLDTRNRIIGLVTICIGTLNSAMVNVGQSFKPAILANAAAVIFCHNHPSGVTSPSPEDVALTRSLVSAGKLLDVHVLDHLIVGFDLAGAGRFTSLKEKGLGFDA